MATVTRRIEVCDVCRDLDRPVVTHVRIAPEGGRLRTFAFCSADYKPLEGVLERVQAVEGAQLSGRRGGSKQVTMAQIEQVKATRRGRPKKTAAATS